MSSVVTFFVFLLIMLALAALAIILDWMGKPIRRSFRPRTSGTPAWLIPEQPITRTPNAVQAIADASPQPDTTTLSKLPAATLAQQVNTTIAPPPSPQNETVPETSTYAAAEVAVLQRPWQPGDSVFRLTPRGTPPSVATVRRRYWKNLSERPSAVLFGAENKALMSIGQAPQRFNPRTESREELQLPEEMLRFCWATKRRPTPTWGDQGFDPYARP